MITSLEQLDLNKTYTYADYLKWQFDECVELIRGKIVRMSPAPSSYHQTVSLNLSLVLGNYLKRQNCKLFVAPFDVRLVRKQNDSEIQTVVQPDLCVICDTTKIDGRGCLGAPDLIIEILSPATSQKDVHDKFDLYEEAGVKEYWIVSPTDHIVDVFLLTEGKYVFVKKYAGNDLVPVNIFESFSIDLKDIFE
jgi:Uma2 family endonuclease